MADKKGTKKKRRAGGKKLRERPRRRKTKRQGSGYVRLGHPCIRLTGKVF